MRHYLDDGLLIRAATRYQVIPNLELTAVNLSLQKQWTEDINTRLEYTESLSGQEARRVTGYLNWDFDKFFLSPRVQFDENFDYLVGLDLQFSLGMDSRTRNWMMTSERLASSGALSARAFLDEDADGVMDEGEEPLEGVTFNGEEYTTDEQGLAFIPRLSANQPRQVSIDKASVSGIGAQPKEERYAVVGRPGVTTELDYPVVPTLEIEGNAFLELDGETLEYPGLPLELVNSDGEVVRELRTEFDGYYYLPDVYPGQYTLRVAAEEQEIKNMIVDEYSIDTTTLRDEGKYEGFVGGYDFVVRLPQEAEADVMVAAVEQQPVNDMDVTSAPETMLPPADTPVAAPSDVVPQIPAVASTPAAPAEPPVPVTKIRSTPLPPEQARRVFVQAGMYCDYENAQRQLDTLKIAGFEATLKGRSYKGQSCYIVHVGPAEDLAAAEMITQQLQDMGLEQPIIVEENAQIYE